MTLISRKIDTNGLTGLAFPSRHTYTSRGRLAVPGLILNNTPVTPTGDLSKQGIFSSPQVVVKSLGFEQGWLGVRGIGRGPGATASTPLTMVSDLIDLESTDLTLKNNYSRITEIIKYPVPANGDILIQDSGNVVTFKRLIAGARRNETSEIVIPPSSVAFVTRWSVRVPASSATPVGRASLMTTVPTYMVSALSALNSLQGVAMDTIEDIPIGGEFVREFTSPLVVPINGETIASIKQLGTVWVEVTGGGANAVVEASVSVDTVFQRNFQQAET